MEAGEMRVGIGYDLHPLKEGPELVLGGVTIEHHQGLAGHSDADVLVHAVCDAMLGALGLGDIGRHFPETDSYRGISSLILLERVAEMVAQRGYRLVNADCVIGAEAPRLAGMTARMSEKIAEAARSEPDRISVKCTRGEGMGPVGEKKAIDARAVVLLAPVGQDGEGNREN